MTQKFPTPPSSAFVKTIKPSNYPYVYMGELNEKHYNNDILERFKGVKKTGSKSNFFHWKVYDWVNDNYYVELKSRNNDFNTYPTTMIGFNKVEEWGKDTSNKRYFFLFAFLDGFYEWELTQENYDDIGGYDAVKKYNFDWEKFATALGFKKIPEFFITSSLTYLKCGTKLLLEEWKTEQWRTYWIYIYIRQIIIFTKEGGEIDYTFRAKHERGMEGSTLELEIFPVVGLGFAFNTFLTNEYYDRYKNNQYIEYLH